jgi:hypothetical protein
MTRLDTAKERSRWANAWAGSAMAACSHLVEPYLDEIDRLNYEVDAHVEAWNRLLRMADELESQ